MPVISPATRVCAILGHPVAHSLSPAIHNAGFAALGLDMVYVAHDVTPADLRGAVAGARALGYRGLSVTIPHKVAALELMDEVDETARGIGCINTIVNENGRLVGRNSDGLGALLALKAGGADPTDRTVLVLGSGGAARAITMTMALQARPARLAILGVVPDELKRLRHDIGVRAKLAPVAHEMTPAILAEELARAELVIHCTPMGMHPAVEQSPVPPELLRGGMAVFDAVYNPRRTRLLRDAAAAGCRTIEGMEMFLGQALVQFELWTGKPAPADVMRAVLEERL